MACSGQSSGMVCRRQTVSHDIPHPCCPKLAAPILCDACPPTLQRPPPTPPPTLQRLPHSPSHPCPTSQAVPRQQHRPARAAPCSLPQRLLGVAVDVGGCCEDALMHPAALGCHPSHGHFHGVGGEVAEQVAHLEGAPAVKGMKCKSGGLEEQSWFGGQVEVERAPAGRQ